MNPTFAIETFEEGKDLVSCNSVYQVKLRSFRENIKVEKTTVEITEADIDKMIDVLHKQQTAGWKSRYLLKADDRVIILTVGSVDGEEEFGEW